MSASGLNAGNHYSFQRTKGLFKKIFFQTCIYESKVRHVPSLSILQMMSQYEIGEINHCSRSSHLVPHAGAVLEEQERGRAEDAETFFQSYLWQVQHVCSKDVFLCAHLVFLLAVTRALEGKRVA